MAKGSNKALNQQQTAAAIGAAASPGKSRKPPLVRGEASPSTKPPRNANSDAATVEQAPTFELPEEETTTAEEEGD